MEARRILRIIAKNQESYFIKHGKYADNFQDIDIDLKNEKIKRYSYQIEVSPDGKSYIATARSISPGIKTGEGNDVWTIDQNSNLKHLVDRCK